MKRILLAVFFCLVSLGSFAQHYELISSFQLAASEGGFGIYSDIDPTGTKDMLFDMEAPRYSQKVQMLLPFSKIGSFFVSIDKAKSVFVKWREIAMSASITQFSKDIPVSFGDQTMFFTSNGRWCKENGVDLKCRFYVDESGNCFLILDTDYMTSDQVVQHGVSYGGAYNAVLGRWSVSWGSSETTITHYCPGASLTFSSEHEIDAFVAKINMVKQWKEGNVSNGKMFK